jgi:hypothetical protein
MNLSRAIVIFLLITGFLLTACGGGGGGGGGGSNTSVADSGGGDNGCTGGGPSVASKGTIDGFGSIFVNGVEFETEQAEVYLNGESSTDNNLQLGMVVTVSGIVSDDGSTGAASKVIFDSDVEGPISFIAPGPDGDSLSFIIFNTEVLVERVGTVIEGASFGSLAVGDFVEVSGLYEGFIDEKSQIRATRVAKKSNFQPGSGEAKLGGFVYLRSLTDTEFILGGVVVVDYSNADLSGLPDEELIEGMWVEVQGLFDGDRIAAERINVRVDNTLIDILKAGDKVSVEGKLTCALCNTEVFIDGFHVDITNAKFLPTGLILQEGLIVQAEGIWNGHELIAQRVMSRRGRIEIEASVASSSEVDGMVTLQLFGGAAAVQVDERTVMEDNTGRANPLTVGDISSGDFLQVEALDAGDFLEATRIDRIAVVDNDILQAPVESFNAGVDITLLGTTYTTEGASFKDKGNSVISPSVFYSELRVGDLVKVLDERLTDGIADEVSFEHEVVDAGTCPSDSGSSCTLITDTVFVDGNEWAQTDLFRGIPWDEINAVCPEGICADNGILNGYDMTGWTWASTDDINTLFNFYIGSEQLGPGPGNFNDRDEDYTTLFGWRFFYIEDEPSLLGGVWRPTWGITSSGSISTYGLTSAPQLTYVDITFVFNTDETPNTSVITGLEFQGGDTGGRYFGHGLHGAWFFRAP